MTSEQQPYLSCEVQGVHRVLSLVAGSAKQLKVTSVVSASPSYRHDMIDLVLPSDRDGAESAAVSLEREKVAYICCGVPAKRKFYSCPAVPGNGYLDFFEFCGLGVSGIANGTLLPVFRTVSLAGLSSPRANWGCLIAAFLCRFHLVRVSFLPLHYFVYLVGAISLMVGGVPLFAMSLVGSVPGSMVRVPFFFVCVSIRFLVRLSLGLARSLCLGRRYVAHVSVTSTVGSGGGRVFTPDRRCGLTVLRNEAAR